MKIRFYFLMILIITILTSSTYAQFSSDKGYEWLISKGTNGSYGTIYDTAFATLALNAVGRDTSKEINFLMENKNPNQFCWPKDNCRVKDTALVLKVLLDHGIDIDQGLKWLEDSRSATDLSGNWYLQVKTEDSGICEIIYSKNTDIKKEINIINGKFTQCNNSTWLNLKSCFDSVLISQFPNPKFLVDCNQIDSAVISLIFNKGSDYYLIENIQGRQADINLRNDCFGIGFKSACNYESSLYASWILKEGKDRLIPFYLEKEYNNANNFNTAFLTLILEGNPYLNELILRQGIDGSWNFNVFNTALASLALKNTQYQDNFIKASNWLKGKQLADGSWNNKIDETALVLYAAFSELGIEQQCFSGERTLCSKQLGVCRGAIQECQDGSYLGCDDNDYLAFNSKYQVNETICDNLDNDCDGSTDEGCVCDIGEEKLCSNQLGVCKDSKITCTTGNWLECNYLDIANYQVNETKCNDNLDNDCDGLKDSLDPNCKSIVTCDIGKVLCKDNICRTNCGNNTLSCINNNLCDQNESCNCQDCDLKSDSCKTGLFCDYQTGTCETELEVCDEGLILCDDGLCRESCKVVCDLDNTCDVDQGEDFENCKEDCSCGDNKCDDREDYFDSCPEDCEESDDTCGDNVCQDFEKEQGICDIDCKDTGISSLCSNGKIDSETFEEGIDCGGACDDECPEPDCNADGICDSDFFEDSNSCPLDCSCGDGECDGYENSKGTCVKDCKTGEVGEIPEEEPPEVEEEKGSKAWIISLILILLIAGIFVYVKYYRKPKKPKLDYFGFKDEGKKPEYKVFGGEKKQVKAPLISTPKKESGLSSAIEKELEKSIEEAKKLIRGK